jgi:hypothetical protein
MHQRKSLRWWRNMTKLKRRRLSNGWSNFLNVESEGANTVA